MQLHLISPRESSTHEVAWLELNTPTGNYVVQHGHAPMVLKLAQDQPLVFRLTSGKQETMNIRRGIAHITRTSVMILINESL